MQESHNAAQVAADLKQIHASAANAGEKAVQSRASFGGFDFGKLLAAYQVITQMIPLIQQLLGLVKSGGTVTIDTAKVSELRAAASRLGITG